MNEEGETWSHRVIKEGWFQLLRIFIDLGADMNIRDSNNNHNNVLHALLAHDRYSTKCVSEVAEYMIKNRGDVDLNALNDLGETPFLCGLKTETIDPIKPSLVRLFEARGRFEGEEVARHALTWAIILDEKEMTQEEFERIVGKCESLGANILEVDEDDGWTLLHSAAYVKIHRSVRYLISRALEVNAKNQDGDTPLNLCLSEHFNFRDPLKIMKTLLEHKADIFLENKEGVSPMDSVTRHPHCFHYLLQTKLTDADESKLKRLVISSIKYGNFNAIKLACKCFKDKTGKILMETIVDGQDSVRESYLHMAIDHYNFQAFKYLVHLQGLKDELLSWSNFLEPRIRTSETKEEETLEDIKIYCLHHKPSLEISRRSIPT